jgi:hypothetical protein
MRKYSITKGANNSLNRFSMNVGLTLLKKLLNREESQAGAINSLGIDDSIFHFSLQ